MNETTTGAPLSATVGERLGDDPHVREVREEVAQRAGASEPGAATREGATASRGGRAARGGAAAREHGEAAARRFPWGALALAAVGWALATGIGRGIRGRARRVGRRARQLVTR